MLAVLSNLDLYDITPQASCCDTARFVAELTSTLQLDVKEGVAFVLRLMFLRWVGDILISFPYEKEKEVLYLSQLLTANVLTEVVFSKIEKCHTLLQIFSFYTADLCFPGRLQYEVKYREKTIRASVTIETK